MMLTAILILDEVVQRAPSLNVVINYVFGGGSEFCARVLLAFDRAGLKAYARLCYTKLKVKKIN